MHHRERTKGINRALRQTAEAFDYMEIVGVRLPLARRHPIPDEDDLDPHKK